MDEEGEMDGPPGSSIPREIVFEILTRLPPNMYSLDSDNKSSLGEDCPWFNLLVPYLEPANDGIMDTWLGPRITLASRSPLGASSASSLITMSRSITPAPGNIYVGLSCTSILSRTDTNLSSRMRILFQ
ncbi:uncharacterized protein LOC116210248 [Punica granatum]|uniref:Uncharacterized protein LOC116210248 n=1 Tax=Punica granatum TaxID=22663 RepID=A0A6P8E3E3_PUNGR|nr:uncharacterized protein LOC116210248 [Punica granatum]